jgi:2-polyprenyl-3-methyl-5-hydroxy-6-metoxy-1,4-benzoquinol methylase
MPVPRIIDAELEVDAELMACRRCTLQWISPPPTDAALRRYHSRPVARTRTQQSQPGDPLFEQVMRAHRMTARWITEIVPPGRRKVLDVGCGRGMFLGALAELGWDCLGVDPNGAFLEDVRRLWGVETVQGMFEDVTDAIPNDEFALVITGHVLHMIPDPVGTIRALATKAQRGGIVHCEVPNELDSYSVMLSDGTARIRRRARALPYRGNKLFYYNARSLRAMVECAGLAYRDERTYSARGLGTFVASRLASRIGAASRVVETVLAPAGRLADRSGHGEALIVLGEKH